VTTKSPERVALGIWCGKRHTHCILEEVRGQGGSNLQGMRRNNWSALRKKLCREQEQSREVQLSLYCTSWGLEASKQGHQGAAAGLGESHCCGFQEL
jgi:hypothetical protein